MATKFQKLKAANIRRLNVGEKLQESGIIVERKPDDLYFYINVMVNRERVHRLVGSENGGTTLADAEAAISKLRLEARHSELGILVKKDPVMTFEKASQEYLQRLNREGGLDLDRKKRRLEMHIVPYFGKKPLTKIEGSDIEEYKQARRNEGALPSTINRELAIISQLFNKALTWKWLKKRPTFKMFREQNRRLVSLTPEEIDRLLAATKNQTRSLLLWLFTIIAVQTSMRKMEILSIKLENIDLAGNEIFLPATKTGARTQYITSFLAEVLREEISKAAPGQVYLFPSPSSKQGHMVAISRSFKTALEEAGISKKKKVVLHTLRHSSISQMVQSGMDLATVQQMAGHKEISMTLRYTHIDRDHVQSALEKFQERAGGKKGTLA